MWSCSAGQEMYHHVDERMSLNLILSQLNQIHVHIPYFSKTYEYINVFHNLKYKIKIMTFSERNLINK
jgi:hypothetical protein